ncbi:MAG: hypothetical protein V4734_07720 [Terriglobus sp.]
MVTQHAGDEVLPEKEADRLVKMRNTVMATACKAVSEPHGLFIINMEPCREEDGKVAVSASMTLHGCGECVVQGIAGALGTRLDLRDLSNLILWLTDKLEGRMHAEGHLKDASAGMVH